MQQENATAFSTINTFFLSRFELKLNFKDCLMKKLRQYNSRKPTLEHVLMVIKIYMTSSGTIKQRYIGIILQ